MPTLNIEGRKVKVDDAFLTLSPEEQARTVDEIAGQLGIAAQAPAIDPAREEAQNADMSAVFQRAVRGENEGAARSIDSFMRGAADTVSFGMADEIAGTGNALASSLNPWSKDFLAPDISGGIREERALQTQRDDADPYSSTTGRVAGGLLGAGTLAKVGAPYMATAPASATLGAKTALGVKSGALYGGLYGLGTGEDIEGRLTEGAWGALTGGGIGGAIPLVAAAGRAIAKPVTDAIKGHFRPEVYANQKIAERLAMGNLTPDMAASKMSKNNLALADVGGENVQALLKTTTNIPGKGQQRVKTQLVLRQMQQGDRIKSLVGKTLADPDGYLQAKDDIAEQAAKLAAPLYKKAYETPVPFTKTLEGYLNTPAVKSALVKAERKMGNQQSEFQQMFANIADDGTVTIKRVPDTQGWDYIKRALDDEISTLRRSGAMDDARIIGNLKNKIVAEIDTHNPSYKEARRVWSGQAKLDEALEFGREAMKMSPEAVTRQMKTMSAAEVQAAQAGLADAIRNSVDNRAFTQNALLKFFGNRQQIENIRAVFANDEQYNAFRKAMFAEAKKRATYENVRGQSSTIKQGIDMAEAGGLEDGIKWANDAKSIGLTGATLKYIGSRMKMLGGFTPEVADKISKKLLTTDPTTVKAITDELARIDKLAIAQDQKRQLVQGMARLVLTEQAIQSTPR